MESGLTTHVSVCICSLTLGWKNLVMFMVMLRKTPLSCFQSVANVNLRAVLNMYYCIYHDFMKPCIKS